MSKQPNIVVICSDQHHPRFSGYRDHPHVRTPNLDRMAQAGVSFNRAYCNSPVCVPSRMSFITGRYVFDIESWMIGVPLDPSIMTWSRRLDQAGIPSTMLGKMDFCGPYQDGGFTNHKILEQRPAWSPYPRQSPWAARLEGYTRPDKRAHLQNAGVRAPAVTDGHHGHDDQFGFYDHDRIVKDWAVEYLKNKGASQDAEPWCLYVGLLYPHWPYCVPEPFFNMYHPDKLDLPHDASFPNPALHPSLRNFQGALDLGEVTEEMLRRVIAAYQGMVTCMDEMIGEILAELERQGLADNTYVIYTSDHGESLGEHGLFYKQCSYEGSVGVPLIIRGPEVPAGGQRDEPVSLVDLYPTVLDMAGLESEPDLPGTSWLPSARGETSDRPDHIFSEHHGNFIREDWYMVVRGDYKYTHYTGQRPTLFNQKEDPQEMSDLSTDPDYKSVRDELEALLRSVADPDEVSLRAKTDLGLIGPNGEDFTQSLTVAELLAGREEGRFEPEPRSER